MLNHFVMFALALAFCACACSTRAGDPPSAFEVGYAPANVAAMYGQARCTSCCPDDCVAEGIRPILHCQDWLRSGSNFLEEAGITVGGHISQGITTNSRNPRNPPLQTGPPATGLGNRPSVFFNTRNDEYMLNQVYLTIARPTDTGGCGWDIGGQIDLIYGTDYLFLQSRGLELRKDYVTNHWNSGNGSGFFGGGRMGLAMPQMYLEVAYNDLTVRLGHFYNILGYERPMATENFFYSSTYGFPHGRQAFPITGGVAAWKVKDSLILKAGVHRGQVNWEDNNSDLNGLFGATWTSRDASASLAYVLDVGKEDDAGVQTTVLQSIVFEKEVQERWSYVLHAVFGSGQPFLLSAPQGTWYGVSQRVAYEINPCWTIGARYGWFDDTDGVAVTFVPTNAAGQGPGPGTYQEITLGLNYKPDEQVTIRPEVRWDWFGPHGPATVGPFGDGENFSQFMAAMDIIWDF